MSIKGIDPVLYRENNQVQHRASKRCLEENIHRITWKGKDRVLDIGSGDGSFTAEVLRNYLPSDLQQLVGGDKSQEMVHYAREKYQGGLLTFKLLELGKPLPSEYLGLFDHVFSFFVLHWVTDLRLAISQIYDLLCEGGDCLHFAVAKAPIVFDAYKRFSKSEKWSQWVKNLEAVTPQFHDCDDFETKLPRMAEEIGFKNVFIKFTQCSHTFEREEQFKNMIASVNPFDIPKELMEEYLEEFVQVVKEEGYLSADLTMEFYNYTLYGKK